MQFTVRQIADFIQGEVEGDENQIINQFNKIEEGKPHGITFLANPKYENFIYETHSTAVVVNKSFTPKLAIKPTLIKVEDAYTAFSTLLRLYEKNKYADKNTIAETAVIPKSVSLGLNVSIGQFAVIGENTQIHDNVIIGNGVTIQENSIIGEGSVIHQQATIYARTILGKNCTIKSGAVIGGGGFGFAPNADGTYDAIPQIGNVVIGDDTHIGANTCIDCGTMGSTSIGNGVKIDNLVQIGHNVSIGNHTVIAAQTGIAGSTKIGNYCVIGGQVGFKGHISVADYTKIGAQAGVSNSIEEERTNLSGSPAFNLSDYLRSSVFFRKLPDFEKRIANLEKLLKESKVINR